ncbi:MAG: hypothetical protein DME66_00285 [Verrucomicrobia bacterium]|nr:MAG: hypothetical protein DME66_00285 [Verrucomicrobiota bacterium]
MSHRFQIQVKTISSRRRGIPADYASFSGAAEVKITNDFAITRLPFLSSRGAQTPRDLTIVRKRMTNWQVPRSARNDGVEQRLRPG